MFPDFNCSPFDDLPGDTDADRAWRFGELIRGNKIHGRTQAESEANAARKQLEWLAKFSDRHAKELLALEAAEARAARPPDLWSWLADRALLDEAEDMSKHPRDPRAPESRLVRVHRRPEEHREFPFVSRFGDQAEPDDRRFIRL